MGAMIHAVVMTLAILGASPSEKNSSQIFRHVVGATGHGIATVVEVKDLDHIVVEADGKQVVVGLANVLPFGQWPNNLTPAESAIQGQLLRNVRRLLIGNRFFLKERHVSPEASETVKVDLSKTPSTMRPGEKMTWTGKRPADKTGWGETLINIRLIEEGVSPLVDHKTSMPRWPSHRLLFLDAERTAAASRVGLWNLPDLARRLTEVASTNSERPALALEGLDFAEITKAGRALLAMPDRNIRVAAVRGLFGVAESSREVEARQIMAMLLETYAGDNNSDVKNTIRDQFHALEKRRNIVKEFLQTVSEDKDSQGQHRAALALLKSL